jgi:hypothetical protein
MNLWIGITVLVLAIVNGGAAVAFGWHGKIGLGMLTMANFAVMALVIITAPAP